LFQQAVVAGSLSRLNSFTKLSHGFQSGGFTQQYTAGQQLKVQPYQFGDFTVVNLLVPAVAQSVQG
jgi:hypothetical protein